jgi:hypothetical protein
MCNGKEYFFPFVSSNYPGAPRPMPAAPLCRSAATLPQQEKNKSADVQRKKIIFFPCEVSNHPGARHHGCFQLYPGGSEPPRQIF